MYVHSDHILCLKTDSVESIFPECCRTYILTQCLVVHATIEKIALSFATATSALTVPPSYMVAERVVY